MRRQQRAHPRCQTFGLSRDIGLAASQMAQCRQTLREPVRIAVQMQCRFQRGEADLVQPQRAFERVAVDRLDQFTATDDETGLRSAEQLVAGEGHQTGALGHCFGHGRLAA